MDDDAQLLDAWRAGDEAAGRELVARHAGLVRRFFASKADHDVDDLVQQTLERMLKHRDAVRDGALFRSYLVTVARSVLIDARRKQGRTPEAAEASFGAFARSDPTPSSIVGHKDEYRALVAALCQLPLDDQILLECSYWEQMSSRELGEVLGVPAPTIRSRLKKAKMTLREALGRVSTVGLSESFHGLQGWADEVRGARVSDSETDSETDPE